MTKTIVLLRILPCLTRLQSNRLWFLIDSLSPVCHLKIDNMQLISLTAEDLLIN